MGLQFDFLSRISGAFVLSAVCLWVLSGGPVLTVGAQPPGAKDCRPEDTDDSAETEDEAEDRRARFGKELDKFEREILQRERRSKFGDPEVERYASELEQKHRENAKLMGSEDGGRDVDEGTRLSFHDEQQHIAMQLWTLERIGNEILQEEGKSGDRLTSRMHDMLRRYGIGVKDDKLLQRFHQLMRRASELSRLRFHRSIDRQFYFAHPEQDSGLPNRPRAASPEFANGPLQSVTEPVGRLVQLRWDDGSLRWDEDHWKTPFAGQTLQSVDEQVRDVLARRNVDLPGEAQNRVAAFQRRQLFEMPLAMLLFHDLDHILSAGQRIPSSYSSTNRRYQGRVRTEELEAEILVSPERNEFSVEEKVESRRRLTVEQSDANGFRLRLIGEHISILEQRADGSVRWISIGDEMTAISAESFVELYSENAERIEQELFARLRHVGIGPPLTRFDPVVVDRLIDRLDSLNAENRSEFESLIERIDSSSFRERQQAYRELSESLSKYSAFLPEVQDLERFSAEARSRLEQLQKEYMQEFNDIDSLITHAGWTHDVDYLTKLVDKVRPDQMDALTAQLKSLDDSNQKPNN